MRWIRCPQVLFLLLIKTGKSVSWYRRIVFTHKHTHTHIWLALDNSRWTTSKTVDYACPQHAEHYPLRVKNNKSCMGFFGKDSLFACKISLQSDDIQFPINMRGAPREIVVGRRSQWCKLKVLESLSINCECNFPWRRHFNTSIHIPQSTDAHTQSFASTAQYSVSFMSLTI